MPSRTNCGWKPQSLSAQSGHRAGSAVQMYHIFTLATPRSAGTSRPRHRPDRGSRSGDALAEVEFFDGFDGVGFGGGLVGTDHDEFRVAKTEDSGGLIASDAFEFDGDHD